MITKATIVKALLDYQMPRGLGGGYTDRAYWERHYMSRPKKELLDMAARQNVTVA